ncbi:MAG: helix-turn-helix domain-containing protein [Arenicella sp.]
MAFNLKSLGNKLKRYRNQFKLTLVEVSEVTGISLDNLTSFESGTQKPTGDEILILSDLYKCDYKFFLSNEKISSFEQTEILFRKHGHAFKRQDRWAIQECLYLAECESYLISKLKKDHHVEKFSFVKKGNYYKGHGKDAAAALRSHLGYSSKEVSMNIYRDMRRIGIKVFRRKLENSNISGVYLKHPVAGHCVLINYNEDIYRQRFTAAHETAHTILDNEEDVLVSYVGDTDLKEVRANSFASAYLIPHEFLQKIPNSSNWSEAKVIEWAGKFKVSAHALAISLLENKLISKSEFSKLSKVKVPMSQKIDPELPVSLPPNSKRRKALLLEQGLSSDYVFLCFEAYREKIISAPRLSEMLLLESDTQLISLAEIYGMEIQYAS